MSDETLSSHATAYESAKNVRLLRDYFSYRFTKDEDDKKDTLTTVIVSARDLPEFGKTDEDFHVVLVKIGEQWYADTVIVVDGSKPKKDDMYRFYEGSSFPLARKMA